MKHLAPYEVENAAEAFLPTAMTRNERLLRWADLLERHEGSVFALARIEHLSRQERRLVSRENSPMTVAFADPILRHDGLVGETLGDAMAFFDLSDGAAHDLFCDCHYHGTLTAKALASRLRALTIPSPFDLTRAYVGSVLSKVGDAFRRR